MVKCKNSREKQEYIITIINENPINIETFKIMFSSIKKKSSNLLKYKWIVLYPDYMIINNFINCHDYKEVEFKCYPIHRSTDIYTLKFIIINFLNELTDQNVNVTYIDSDHIFLNPLYLTDVKEREIILSSEDCIVNINFYGNIKNYNCSFIRASLQTWLEVVSEWKDFYFELKKYSDSRFNEEIAFSLSIKKQNLIIKQLDTKMQSNFKLCSKYCSCFHYGGEYKEAKEIKHYLAYPNLCDKELWLTNKISETILII